MKRIIAGNIEQAARLAWQTWGADYAGYYVCSKCKEFKVCRRTSRSGWLCLECFDQR